MNHGKENNHTGMKLEERLENGGWKDAVRGMTLPQQMKESLLGQMKNVPMKKRQKAGNSIWYRRRAGIAAAAACTLLVLAVSGMTAHAVYVRNHLNVFFEKGITKEQMHGIEEQLLQMEGVVSCRYIDGGTAWKIFEETYLTPELMEEFTSNPLADSDNFRVGVAIDADAEEMKELIGELDGVRLVSGLWEE